MKQTTIKELIKDELLRTCSEVTTRLREKDEKKEKKRQFSREKIAEIENKMKAVGWTGATGQHLMELFSVLHDAPELKAGSLIPFELFEIVVLEANATSSHAYVLNKPHIVTEPKSRYLIHNDGVCGNWAFQAGDKPRLATAEEVEACINSLNDKQWKTIMTHDIFKPIIDRVMIQQIQVEDHSDNGNGSGDDVKLEDGRTLVT